MPVALTDIVDPKQRVTVAEFERRLAKLSRRHRTMIRDALGSPPDPSNIPQSLWDRIEREHRAALTILLYGASLATLGVALGRMNRSGTTLDDVESVHQALDQQAAARATWVAESVTGTSRSRLDRLNSEEPPELETVLRETFGSERMSSIARNEAVAAQALGGSSLASVIRQQDGNVTEIWHLGDCEHCEVCPMLHLTAREFWGQWSDGPPLHPNCRCFLQVEFDHPTVLTQQGRVRSRNPSYGIVNQKMSKFARK